MCMCVMYIDVCIVYVFMCDVCVWGGFAGMVSYACACRDQRSTSTGSLPLSCTTLFVSLRHGPLLNLELAHLVRLTDMGARD